MKKVTKLAVYQQTPRHFGRLLANADREIVGDLDPTYAKAIGSHIARAYSLLRWVSRCATMTGPAGTQSVFVSKKMLEEIREFVEEIDR